MPPQPDPLPKRPNEELQRLLRESLQRKRPRRVRLAILSMLVVAGLGGLILWLIAPRGEPPLLACVAFEDLDVAGAKVILHGRLEGARDAEVAGKDVAFEIDPGQKTETVTTVTGPHGECSCVWAFPVQAQEGHFILRQIGTKFRPGTEDRGRIFLRPSATPLCLVQIEGALTPAMDQAWHDQNSEDINPRPGAAEALRSAREKGYAIVYLALAADRPTLYQKMRGWVAYHSTAGAVPLPTGVVLSRFTLPGQDHERQPWQKTAELLGERFILPKEGNVLGHVAIAGSVDAARQLQAAGLRTLYLGDGEILPAEIKRVPDWRGVFE